MEYYNSTYHVQNPHTHMDRQVNLNAYESLHSTYIQGMIDYENGEENRKFKKKFKLKKCT